MARKLYLMRHGETLFNKQRRFQGASDSPLTVDGIEQGLRAGKRLSAKGLSFDHFYCSTSERATDTLELVMEGMGIGIQPYERMKGLKEFNRGRFEGEPLYLIPPNPAALDTFYVDFGGETNSDSVARLRGVLSLIMERDGHENVLCVSHGGVGRLFLKDCGIEPADVIGGKGHMPNCVVVIYDYDAISDGGAGDFSYAGIILPEEQGFEGAKKDADTPSVNRE